MASRIDSEGRVLDDPPLLIDQRGRVMSIAFDGTNYFVIYADDLGYGDWALIGRRISTSDGEFTLPDSAPVRIAGPGAEPAGLIHDGSVSWGAGYFLVAWYRHLGGKWDVATVRITADGTVVGQAEPVPSLGDRGAALPSTSFDGTNFLVAWTTGNSIEGTFIDPATGEGARSAACVPRARVAVLRTAYHFDATA